MAQLLAKNLANDAVPVDVLKTILKWKREKVDI